MSAPLDGGLRVRELHARFGRHDVLRGIDLDVAAGETLVLFGTSGAGKTVLLRAIAGLEPAATGEIHIAGRDVSMLGPEARDIGMAFQNFALYPHMTARENIASPLHARRCDAAEIERRVSAVASLLRIGHVLGQPPRALSNGQKQRTALARALVAEPKLLLLDDPLRNVDAKLRYEMRLELPRLLRRAGAATIYVTQDYREAMALGDRIAVLREGRVAQIARPETIYDAPCDVAVARLFGDPPLNLLPCRLQPEGSRLRVEAAGLRLLLDAEVAAGEACLLGLRPEAMILTREAKEGASAAQVIAVTPLHERFVVLLRASEGTEIVASTTGQPPTAGTQVWVCTTAAGALLFEAASGRIIARRTAPAECAA
jgi:multiple sugar transport system ATP-binding protein